MFEIVALIIILGIFSIVYLYNEYRERREYDRLNKKYQEWVRDLLSKRYKK